MVKKREGRRRDRIDIISCILKDCINETGTTRLLYNCRLSYDQFTDYTKKMIEEDLITESYYNTKFTYRITDKGKRLLELYMDMLELTGGRMICE